MSVVGKNDNVALEERIERIRKNNERIQRRHLEVEADKQKAAKSNALVQLKQLPDEEPFTHPYTAKPKQEVKYSENDLLASSPRMQKQATTRSCYKVAENAGGKCFSFSESDGPPPDPVYNFLADVERDPKFGNPRGNVFRGSRGGRATLAYYREREANMEAKNRNRRRGYEQNISVKPEYEAWKNERFEIDRQRINRQKTAGGEWRREWDKEKTESMDNSTPEKVERKSFQQYEKNTLRNYIQNFDSDKTGSTKKFPTDFSASTNERGNLRVSRANVRGQRVVSYSSVPASSANSGTATVPKSQRPERTVTDLGDSLKVSLPNNESPIQKAKVASRSTAGSGRVPHQKYRTSYSSQSEDDSTQKPVVRKSGKRSFQSFRGEDNNKGNQASDKGEKVASVDDDRVVKPPLHPNTERKIDPLKPKKQRGRYLKNDKNRQRDKLQNVSKSNESNATKQADSSSKDDVSGDDGWEDVATSGTESMSEDVFPKEQKEEININANYVKSEANIFEVKSEVNIVSSEVSETNSPSDIEKNENNKNVNVEAVSDKKSLNTECESNVPEPKIYPEINDQICTVDKCESNKERKNENLGLMTKENEEKVCSAREETSPETKDLPVYTDKYAGNNNMNGNLEIVNVEKTVNVEENMPNQSEAVNFQETVGKQIDLDKPESNKDSAGQNVENVNIIKSDNILNQLSGTCPETNKLTDNDTCESNKGCVNETAEITGIGKHDNDDVEITKEESSDGMRSHENIEGLTNAIQAKQEIKNECKIESCSKILSSEIKECSSDDGKLTTDKIALKSDLDTNGD